MKRQTLFAWKDMKNSYCLYNLKFRRVEVKIFCCMQCLASPEVIQLYFLLNSAELEVCFMFKQLR